MIADTTASQGSHRPRRPRCHLFEGWRQSRRLLPDRMRYLPVLPEEVVVHVREDKQLVPHGEHVWPARCGLLRVGSILFLSRTTC